MNADIVEKAADSLSAKLDYNIIWYRKHASVARLWHYSTIITLIILSSITPLLTSVIAALSNPPLFLKLFAVATTSGAGIVIWIRAVGDYQQQWRTFYLSQLAIIRMRRKYKFDRAKLGDDLSQKLQLIEDTFSDMDSYVEEESKKTFIGMLKASSSVETAIKNMASERHTKSLRAITDNG